MIYRSPAPINVVASTIHITTSTSFNVPSATFNIYSPSLFLALLIQVYRGKQSVLHPRGHGLNTVSCCLRPCSLSRSSSGSTDSSVWIYHGLSMIATNPICMYRSYFSFHILSGSPFCVLHSAQNFTTCRRTIYTNLYTYIFFRYFYKNYRSFTSLNSA